MRRLVGCLDREGLAAVSRVRAESRVDGASLQAPALPDDRRTSWSRFTSFRTSSRVATSDIAGTAMPFLFCGRRRAQARRRRLVAACSAVVHSFDYYLDGKEKAPI